MSWVAQRLRRSWARWMGMSLYLFGTAVLAQDIVLGQSVPLSGPEAEVGRDLRDGALAVFTKVNASGQLGARKIQLVTLDNANDRARARETTRQLVDVNHAVALFGYHSTNMIVEQLPSLKQNNMALFAPFTGSPDVRSHPNVFSARASFKDEVEKIVAHQKSIGAVNAVIIHYDDEAGRANAAVAASAFDAGLKPRTLAVKRNAKLDAAVFEPVFKDPPQFALVVTHFTVVGDLLQAAAAKGVNLRVAAISSVNPDKLVEAYGAVAQGTIVSQVVPPPRGATLTVNAAVKDCAALLQSFNGAKLNYTSLESCLAAKALVRVIQKMAPGPVTRTSLLKGLEDAGRIDLDGYALNFNHTNGGSSYVDLTILARGNQFAR